MTKMAEKKAAPAEEPAAPKRSLFKSKKFLIAVVALLAVAGGAYKFLAPAPKPGPPVAGDIVTIDPTTLNLADGHYLKVGVAVQLIEGKATKDTFQISKAQEITINTFTNLSVQSLSNKNRSKLKDDLAKAIKKAYPDEIYTVYLTQFVTQ